MLAIGNGESRASIDIDKINGPKVGCNALWRDYHTDYLVCVDRRMVDESIRGKVNLNDTLIYTREDWYDRYQKLPKVRKLPSLPYNGEQRWDEPFQWGSGPYAVFISALFGILIIEQSFTVALISSGILFLFFFILVCVSSAKVYLEVILCLNLAFHSQK